MRQGDHLRRLAHARGVSPESIWEHDDNADLRAARESMEALLPGDILWLPSEPAGGVAIMPQQSNSYRAHVPWVDVELTLRDAAGEPLANASVSLEGARERSAQTDGGGVLAIQAAAHRRQIQVTLDDDGRSFGLRIGHLDPIEAPSGVDGRLENLGYFVSLGIDGDEHERDLRRRAALRDFQSAQGLEPSGEIDDATRDALREAHGS